MKWSQGHVAFQFINGGTSYFIQHPVLYVIIM